MIIEIKQIFYRVVYFVSSNISKTIQLNNMKYYIYSNYLKAMVEEWELVFLKKLISIIFG